MSFRMSSAKELASRMASPFGSRPVVVNPAPCEIEPVQKRVFEDVRADVFRLPSFDSTEYQIVSYWSAWQEMDALCGKEPLKIDFCKSATLKTAHVTILLQMQDTFGTVIRVKKWMTETYGPRIFEHTDEPLQQFFQLIRAGQSFGPPTATGTANALFFYPTDRTIDELLRAETFGVRVVVVLDNIYVSSAKTLRQRSEIKIIGTLGSDVLANCAAKIKKMWLLSTDIQKNIADPRKMFHVVYFNRFLSTESSFGNFGNSFIERSVFQWVHFWFLHGSQNLYEYYYDKVISISGNGIVSKTRGSIDEVGVVAWEYAKLPKPARKTLLPITADQDADRTLSYLQFAAPWAIYKANKSEWTEATADALEMLSDADLQQSRFHASISPLHEGAVRYGLKANKHYENCTEFALKVLFVSEENITKKFMQWLERQNGKTQKVQRTLEIVEFAPFIEIHKSETLARLLYIADPNNDITYWPTAKLFSAKSYYDAMLDNCAVAQPLDQLIAWRLIWAYVAQQLVLPKRPAFQMFRMPETIPSEHLNKCCASAGKIYQWCQNCGAAPSTPIVRCENCFGWGSCLLCGVYNQAFYSIALQASVLEKI